MHVKPFPVVLEQAFMLTPKVKHFVFRSEIQPVFDYVPGQFVTIHFDNEGKRLRRSYSIANVPRQDNLIEFAAGYVENGPGTELLFNLKPGDTVDITGPFGRLTLKDELPKRYVLVATSTGVTPYRAMLPEIKHRLDINPELKVLLLQGVQTRQDVLYKDDFLQMQHEYPRFEFLIHLSREKTLLHSHERLGYVQSSFPDLTLNPEEDVVYLCGNPGMIDTCFHQLKELEFNMKQIIREKYISGK